MILPKHGCRVRVFSPRSASIKSRFSTKILRKDRRAKYQVNIAYELCVGIATKTLAAYKFRANIRFAQKNGWGSCITITPTAYIGVYQGVYITFAQNCTPQKFAMCQSQGMYAWTGRSHRNSKTNHDFSTCNPDPD